MVPEDQAQRAVETAYTLGARDAQRLAAGVARREHETQEEAAKLGRVAADVATMAMARGAARQAALLCEERALVAARILDDIRALDPTRAQPALEVLLAETGHVVAPEPAYVDGVPTVQEEIARISAEVPMEEWATAAGPRRPAPRP